MKNKSYISLIVWIAGLICIGALQGSLISSDINTWYSLLNRSPYTPGNYVFPVVWTLLYAIIGISGWIIWGAGSFEKLRLIKGLFLLQLLLNWSWTPLFFRYHLTGISLACLILMDIVVAQIIYLTYSNLRSVSLLMIPYLLWLLFATYLNFYVWHYN